MADAGGPEHAVYLSSYRHYPLRLRLGLIGLAALVLATWMALWLRTAGDARVGLVITVATAVVVPGVPILLVLFLTGKVWAHRYLVGDAGVEVQRGALRHRMVKDEITAIALVRHHSETFVGFVDRRGRGILLGRGLSTSDLGQLLRQARELASSRGIRLSQAASVREFRRMASAGLAYGLPF